MSPLPIVIVGNLIYADKFRKVVKYEIDGMIKLKTREEENGSVPTAVL